MKLARMVASAGGVGFAPAAPGTWGSLLAAFLGAGLLAVGGRGALAVGIVLATAAGLWAIPRAGGDADPGWVVIDEVAGMWIALLPLPRPTLLGVTAAFLLFRLLDIAKPGPIGRIDQVPGRMGVMGDDLAAGLVAAGALWLFLALGLPS